MTEEDWLAATNLTAMLQFLNSQPRVGRTKARRRKLRLFASACCREVWPLLHDDRSRKAVATIEAFADGRVGKDELKRAEQAALEATRTARDCLSGFAARGVREAARANSTATLPTFYWTWGALVRDPRTPGAVRQPQGDDVQREQGELLHHIVGNPFRPYPEPPSWPAPVVALAESLYGGDAGAAAPLHDALLEAGHPGLARHFQDASAAHPKGCWAVDVLTGRK